MKLAALSFVLSASLASAYTAIPWFDPATNPSPPVRYDIENLQAQDPEQYDLFMLGMQRWMTTSPNDVGGYFQVCGIHGAPFQYWDPTNNAGSFQRTGEGAWFTGYCFHDEQNFYLWHRPYLALFEQRIAAVATSIANSWTTAGGARTRYQAAARRLRLPYWDWAKQPSNGQVGRVPTQLSSNTVSVRNPSTGNMQSITNPLIGHTLVSGANLGTYSGGGRVTLGGGDGRRTGRTASYQNNMIAQGPSLRRWVAQLLGTPGICWNVFATYDSAQQSICRNQPSVNSLEGIHNSVHNSIAGTMGNLATAAYDPIFWLHHCNVDRIGALWQGVNRNTRVVPTISSSSTWISNRGVLRDETFNLLPFRWRNTDRDWWQPRWLYDVRATGYTYPELRNNPSAAALQQTITNLYGTGRTQLSVSENRKRRVRRSDRLALLQYRQVNAGGANLTIAPPVDALAPIADTLIKGNGSFDEYTVKVSIRKSVTTGKSFNLHLFFGNPARGAKTHSDYLRLPNRIGGYGVALSQAMDTNSDQMKKAMDQFAEGVVPITDALLNLVLLGNLKDMKPATVRRYCRAKLTWRLVTIDDEDIGRVGVNKGLRIRVQHVVVTPDAGNGSGRPIVPPAGLLEDATNSTTAKPLPSGVAASSAVASATTTDAAGGIGPVPLPTDA